MNRRGSFLRFLAYCFGRFLSLFADSLGGLLRFLSYCFSGFLGFFARGFESVLNRLSCLFRSVLYIFGVPLAKLASIYRRICCKHSRRRLAG